MGSLPWTSAVLSAHLLSQSENRNGAELLTKLHSGQAIVVGLVSADADGSFKAVRRSEEHTSELQSLMRISYAVFCLKKKKKTANKNYTLINNKQKRNTRDTEDMTQHTLYA